jgi:hypothetical protein
MVTFPVPPAEKLAEAKAKNAFLERQGVTRHGLKFFRSGTPLLPAEVDALAACRTEVWNFAAGLFFGCARSFFHLNGR